MTMLTGNNRIYLVLAVLALVAIVTVGWVTMAGAESPDTGTDGDSEGSMKMAMSTDPDGDSGIAYEGPSGIWVSGTGKASGAPDIAVISLGVESIEETAAEARSNAATAMSGVMTALTETGVSLDDIQTSYFNISPRYQSVEVQRCEEAAEGEESAGDPESTTEKTCYKVWESKLIGYAVSNQATIKIRSLSTVGAIIDKVTESAEDLVRINGISFDIDDPQPLQDEAMASAVADLKRKATMLAELSGVKLGRLVYINEQASYSPPQPLYARAEAASADFGGKTTSISGGKLEVSISLQGVYLIAEKVAPEPAATIGPEHTEEPPEETPEATEASN